MRTVKLLFFSLVITIHFAFSQDCKFLLSDVNKAILHAQHNLDSTLTAPEKPDYPVAYIIYPVLNRYYNKSKNRDTAFVRRFEDFARTVWCFKGTCFNNNKSFYLSKKEIIEKLNSNDLSNSYQRETICMLCDKYLFDTTAILKVLNYGDTIDIMENANAIKYSLLHKALQVANLRANKCINNEIFERYRYQLTDTIYKKFITPFFNSNQDNTVNNTNENDLLTEALLMISILDDSINISDNLYELILKAQLSDGGWSISNNTTNSNGHTTIVSLWLLMDLQKKLKAIR